MRGRWDRRPLRVRRCQAKGTCLRFKRANIMARSFQMLIFSRLKILKRFGRAIVRRYDSATTTMITVLGRSDKTQKDLRAGWKLEGTSAIHPDMLVDCLETTAGCLCDIHTDVKLLR